jgi:hypothetical protein
VTGLPPRSDVLAATPLLLSSDVDCGELVRGRRFIARGGFDGLFRYLVPVA